MTGFDVLVETGAAPFIELRHLKDMVDANYGKKRAQEREAAKELRAQLSVWAESIDEISRAISPSTDKTIAAINALADRVELAATNRKRERRETWAFLTGIATLVFVGAYTVLTYCLLKTAKDTEQRQLRAYVFISQSQIADVGSDKAPTATIRLKNSGQTPAYNVRLRMATFSDVIENKDFPPPKLIKVDTALGPGADQFANGIWSAPVGKAQIDAFKINVSPQGNTS